jgi:hypothetical protein
MDIPKNAACALTTELHGPGSKAAKLYIIC